MRSTRTGMSQAALSAAAVVLLAAPLAAEVGADPPARLRDTAATPAPTPRTQTTWNSGDPTADEQYTLEVINRARANPTAEGTRLGIDIKEGLSSTAAALVGTRPPLAMNSILLGTARAHSQDMYVNHYFMHPDLSGNDPFTRMTNAGYNWQIAAENIAASSNATCAQLEDLLMVDSGITDRGHRENLLDIRNQPYTREVGVGFYGASGANASGFRDLLTQDFGATAGSAPFVVGVVYNDANGNGFYDIGEGLAGITVTPDAGSYKATTGTAGGYAFPSVSGTRTITFTGTALGGTVVKTVTVGTANVKVDAKKSEATSGTTTSGTTTSGTTTSGTTTSGTTTSGTTTTTSGGTTGSTTTAGTTTSGGTVGTGGTVGGSGSGSGSGSGTGGGVAPSGSSSSGGCGLGGALVGLLTLVGLLWPRLRRRR
jgi:hypothetical protein